MNKNESLTILQDALIIGCDFQIKHGSIAPYSHGYFVTSEYVNYDERRAARELAKELLDLDLE